MRQAARNALGPFINASRRLIRGAIAPDIEGQSRKIDNSLEVYSQQMQRSIVNQYMMLKSNGALPEYQRCRLSCVFPIRGGRDHPLRALDDWLQDQARCRDVLRFR
jgi:hypothetical protein